MVENVPELVDLAPLDQRRLAEDHPRPPCAAPARHRGSPGGCDPSGGRAPADSPADCDTRWRSRSPLPTRPTRVSVPSAAIPSATITQCSPMCTPSISSATRSRASRGAVCHACNCAVVRATKRRLTLLLLVPRLGDVRRDRLQAPRILPRGHTDQHLLERTPVQRILARPAPGTSARALRGRRRAPAAAARRPSGRPAPPHWAPCPPARRRGSASCTYRGPQSVVRSSSSIASNTRRPDRIISSNDSALVSSKQIDEGQRARRRRFREGTRAGYARLLHGGSLLAGLRPGLVTTRVSRAVRSRRFQISTVSGTSPKSHGIRSVGARSDIVVCGRDPVRLSGTP